MVFLLRETRRTKQEEHSEGAIRRTSKSDQSDLLSKTRSASMTIEVDSIVPRALVIVEQPYLHDLRRNICEWMVARGWRGRRRCCRRAKVDQRKMQTQGRRTPCGARSGSIEPVIPGCWLESDQIQDALYENIIASSPCGIESVV